jgi:hypothetical protein
MSLSGHVAFMGEMRNLENFSEKSWKVGRDNQRHQRHLVVGGRKQFKVAFKGCEDVYCMLWFKIGTGGGLF